MDLHKPVCGPGRAWKQSTSCYLIGRGWLTSTHVYSSNGLLYYDSFWQTYLVRRRFFFFPPDNCSKSCFQSQSDSHLPVCILQTHKLEGMQTHIAISQADVQQRLFLCFVFPPRSDEEGIQIPQGLQQAWCGFSGARTHRKHESPSLGPGPIRERWWIWHPASEKPGLSMPFEDFPSRAEGCSIQICWMFGGAI